MTDVRITRQDVEVLRGGDPDVRITRQGVEVLRGGDPSVRITRQSVEVLRVRPVPPDPDEVGWGIIM